MNKESIIVELREFKSDDITKEYIEAHNTNLAKFYSGSGSRMFDKKSIAEEIESGLDNGTRCYYGIYEINCNELIGTIIIQDINLKNKTADVVPFIFNEHYFKYRLGSIAIKLGCQKAFDDFDIRKVFGGINKNNIGAVKTFFNSNYVIEGIRKAQYGSNTHFTDEILVACFNQKYFSEAFMKEYKITFEDIYEK
tara:strand:- start:24013 stop:24597 length:585 start_codon:yes stop_codon:yes gene_type:complete